MRAVQRTVAARSAVALLVSALLSLAAWWAGKGVMLAILFALLAVVLFALLTVAPDVIAAWRGHYWRWAWRSPGGDWTGVREPRRPRLPFMPSRGAAARPDGALPNS